MTDTSASTKSLDDETQHQVRRWLTTAFGLVKRWKIEYLRDFLWDAGDVLDAFLSDNPKWKRLDHPSGKTVADPSRGSVENGT